jgi:NTE family protein
MPQKPGSSPKGNKSISLALQGGGAHAAFTWGVVDQLLLDGRLDIKAISATSSGAILAAVLAQGLHDGGNEGARDALLNFWRKISIASSLMPLRMNVVDKFLGHVGIDLSASSMALDYLTKIFSPYQFNLFDINPLRGIVEEVVDFNVLNKKSPVGLYINATNARTGKSRIFEPGDLSLDALMASSCLPFIFKTVEIDGEPYWDGSFSGCPALAPLINHDEPGDIVLIQIHPSFVDETPTTAADILDRATEISFHSVLLHEMKTIELYNGMIESGALDQNPVFLHRIEAQDMLTSLGRASKLKADWDFLIYLHDIGVQTATDWLNNNFDQLGKSSSLDIRALVA